MISSKAFERWLISITDMPTPGSDNISSRACSKTGTGITAGPALKLKIRSVIVVIWSAPAERSGDGALDRHYVIDCLQSKAVSPLRSATALQIILSRDTAS